MCGVERADANKRDVSPRGDARTCEADDPEAAHVPRFLSGLILSLHTEAGTLKRARQSRENSERREKVSLTRGTGEADWQTRLGTWRWSVDETPEKHNHGRGLTHGDGERESRHATKGGEPWTTRQDTQRYSRATRPRVRVCESDRQRARGK